MKFTALLLSLTTVAPWVIVSGQATSTALPPPATAPAGATSAGAQTTASQLTEAQVNAVLTQLGELERQVRELRGSNLATVLQKLREGLASDQAAMSLYLECDKIVNAERKEMDKSEARRREENMQRGMQRKGKGAANPADDQGDFGVAVRLGLQYLVLTLEAHEAEDEDLKKMVPKLQSYIVEAVAAAPKLKGRSYQYLNNAQNSPIVEAFQLGPFLQRKGWSSRPLDFGKMYSDTILPSAEENNKDLLPGLWDARINAESAFRKEQMFEPEYLLWVQKEVPSLRWERAKYLYDKGPSPVSALADMLRLIKENPSHVDAPAWLKELRMLVQQSAPAPVSGNLEKTAGT